ncbi:hypothetical protein OAL81_04255 [Candidatus Pelagibacter sp.]|jgi:dTDP-4-amino-4,6-dideoxy-D-glucose ammonia-lyase|nr:hypothetical protein [Candidatus Pelagibacter sp.]|tara:strand:+ start:6794 stop:8353 length:1560 start_codon:yes stop_codon:yes gene_type:complete
MNYQNTLEIKKYFLTDDFNKINSETLSFFTYEISNFLKNNNLYSKNILKSKIKSNYIEKIIKIVFLFSRKPLISHSELCKLLQIEKNDLILLNELIRNIKSFQEIIIKRGVGTKYWTNSIIPLYNSNSVDDFLNNKYSFPFRIGLFPGLSCMFECSFCGRNYNAVYKRDALEVGMETFFKLIEEAPKNDPARFFLSGGLEPLTNPKLNSLINKLKENNFNASLYTNAYMLTEKYLKKNPSIFNLDSLRISYYGVTSESTYEVTKKQYAFKTVNQNILSYLKLKEENKSNTLFGLNYVILKNKSADVISLLKIMSQANKEMNNNKNNFNFLTLREDFRILGERMTKPEREDLVKNLTDVDKCIEEDEHLKNLFIDYGFALEPIRNGYVGEKFEDNFASKKDLEILGVPQARVVVDLYGDVYLFGEAGFLDRPGAKRYIIGNLIKQKSMKNVITEFIHSKKDIDILEEDRDYLDAWDHIALKFANQLKKNSDFGISIDKGAINLELINSIIKSNYKVHYSS